MYDNILSQSVFPKTSLLGVGILSTMLAACGGNGGSTYQMPSGTSGGTGTNMTGTASPSSVSLTSPGSSVNRTVTLQATPVPGTGLAISRVDFLVDGSVVGTAMTSPYSVKWDTTTVTDGTHMLTVKATDSGGAVVTSTAVSVSVLNKPSFSVSLSPAQLFPTPASSASGAAMLTVNLANGMVSGKVVLTGLTASSVKLYEGFAGANGVALIALAQNAAASGEWDLAPNAMLTSDQVAALLEGGLYIAAASTANPNGELRGQIIPGNVRVVWTSLAGAQEVPPVTITASGIAATTVDSVANTVSVYIDATGVNDATAAELDTGAQGAVGAKLVSLTKDAVNMGMWSATLSPITATDLNNFVQGNWYVNVRTPAFPNGALRGQITPQMAGAAPTLAQLQSQIFTPKCSSCHDGVGTAPPGVLNLMPGGSYKALVNVAALEQPNLKYVVPGDPANSYLMQKLLGSTGISGARMPLNGPYLDAATLQQVAAWIAAGASNN